MSGVTRQVDEDFLSWKKNKLMMIETKTTTPNNCNNVISEKQHKSD